MKKVNCDKYFEFNGMPIVSRGDYEGLPATMCAVEFDDNKMQRLADLIYNSLSVNYRIEESRLKNYFSGNRIEVEDEDIDDAFWREMEECAVYLGMRYYEDMSDDEYKLICDTYNENYN